MKIHRLVILFFILMLSSCTQQPQKPKPFLSESQMVELLTQMHLTEVSLQQMQTYRTANFDSTLLYTNAAYSTLFGQYGLKPESFEANLLYRVHFSRDLEKIYSKVRDNLIRLDTLSRPF